jgi:hypothetical protein
METLFVTWVDHDKEGWNKHTIEAALGRAWRLVFADQGSQGTFFENWRHVVATIMAFYRNPYAYRADFEFDYFWSASLEGLAD